MADVTIYTREMCGYCSRALKLLKSKGIDFEQIDAGMNPEKRKEMIQRANGGSTYPQVFIKGEHIGGSDDLMALERNGALDAMLGNAG
ncbi:MAG: glutaredoxin 3 [Maricaulis sp.]|jgi:glutaredoxin 3|nr:glutaredoxin 3 [Maricaulis sp.]HAQ36430.1 glutaredoxin 3 [Alphaproteobacteria bacterium]